MICWLALLRALLRGAPTGTRRSDVFSFQTTAFDHAHLLVRAFYAGNLLWAGLRLEERARWFSHEAAYLLWPLSWLDGGEVSSLATNIYVFNAITATIAVIFCAYSPARWLAFAGALAAGAFENSFGRICHYGHTWVWVCFFFAFLPSGLPATFFSSRVLRQRYLQIFWSTQFALLFFYSMAGWLKLVSVPVQYLRGEVTAIGSEALARHVANAAMQSGPVPMFANWFIDNTAVSWAFFLGAIYLEAVAVLIAFRPDLHRWWGIGLMLLHFGIGMVMEIWFVPPLFILALLFVFSPFDRGTATWREKVLQLPGIEVLAYMWQQFRPAPSVVAHGA
jgi:hypothetical protein